MNTDDEKGPLKRVPIIKIQSQQQKKDSLCHINLSNLGHVYCSGLELCVINMYLRAFLFCMRLLIEFLFVITSAEDR